MCIIQATLEQTLPDDNLPICSGQTLIYTSNTTTGVIRWEEGDKSITYSTAVTLNLNVRVRLRQFTVQLISIDGTDLSSTAISQNTSFLDEGSTIVCQDGITSLVRSITIAGMCMIVHFNTINTFPPQYVWEYSQVYIIVLFALMSAASYREEEREAKCTL